MYTYIYTCYYLQVLRYYLVNFFIKNKLILFIRNIKFNNNDYEDIKYRL